MIGKAIDRMSNWVNDSQIDKPDGGSCIAYRVDFREEELLLLLERFRVYLLYDGIEWTCAQCECSRWASR